MENTINIPLICNSSTKFDAKDGKILYFSTQNISSSPQQYIYSLWPSMNSSEQFSEVMNAENNFRLVD